MKLEVKDLHVEVEGKKILNGVSFTVDSGEVCVIMGPNGAGKSTISNVIMGNPKYSVISGQILLDGEDVTRLGVDERAKRGLFMSFQHPVEINGVTLTNFLRTSYNAIKGTNLRVGEFHKLIADKMKIIDMDPKFRTRSINFGFSGGEKKRTEILQMMLFEPKFAILDEIDSGLDVDALKSVSHGINKVKEENNTGMIIVTHYNKILDYIKPDKVIVVKNGRVEQTGNFELAKKIEAEGFN